MFSSVLWLHVCGPAHSAHMGFGVPCAIGWSTGAACTLWVSWLVWLHNLRPQLQLIGSWRMVVVGALVLESQGMECECWQRL